MLPDYETALNFLAKNDPKALSNPNVLTLTTETPEVEDSIYDALSQVTGEKSKTLVTLLQEDSFVVSVGLENAVSIAASMQTKAASIHRAFRLWVAQNFPLDRWEPSPEFPGILLFTDESDDEVPLCVGLIATFEDESFRATTAIVRQHRCVFAAECLAIASLKA